MDIRTNGPMKVIAKILVSFLALGITVFGAAVFVNGSNGIASMLEDRMYFDVLTVRSSGCLDGASFDKEFLNREFGSDVTNLRLEIKDADGKVLFNNGSLKGLETNYAYVDEEGVLQAQKDSVYTIAYALEDVENLTVEDTYKGLVEIGTMLAQKDNLYVSLFVVCLLFFVLDTVYLFTAAGHKKDQDGISLSWVDAIPLDVLAGLTVLFLIGYSFVCTNIVSAYTSPIEQWNLQVVRNGILVFALCSFPMGYAILEWLLSFARHIKAGKWYNSLLCVKICRFLIQWIGRGFATLRYEWRVVVALLVNIILVYMSGSGDVAGLSMFGWLCYAIYACWALVQIAHKVHNLKEGAPVYNVDTKHLLGTFRVISDELSDVEQGVYLAVEKQIKAEKLKTELITNVSHDIKTPLTSIVNYVDLLNKEHTKEQEKEYLEVLSRNSDRLKRLTEDLIESSKASSGSMNVDLLSLNVQEILDQAVGEYEDKLSQANLTPMVHVEPEDLRVVADGRLLWRVLSNLLSNCVKYAMPMSRVYIDAIAQGNNVVITVKNISRETLNIPADELMERFVRQDKSRSTSGSGLGLDIAKSLTVLMKGSFDLEIDGDLFKAKITLGKG